MVTKKVDITWIEVMGLEMTLRGAVRITLNEIAVDFPSGGALRFVQAIGEIVRNAHAEGKNVEFVEKKA